VELPVSYSPRSADQGKKLSPRVGWSVLRAIVRVRVQRARASTAPIDAHEREQVAAALPDRDDLR
jgi:hypothetical protein